MVLSYWDAPKVWDIRAADIGRCYKGIHLRAAQLGYRVDSVCVKASGISPSRLKRILETRAIEGIIIFAPPDVWDFPGIDFARYACAILGRRKDGAFPAVDVNIEASMHAILTEMTKLGYARLGIVNANEGSTRVQVDRRLIEDSGMQHSLWNGSVRYRPAFESWVRDFRPEVLLVSDSESARAIINAGYLIPDDFALAMLSRFPQDSKFAGVDPCFEAQGASLVDLVLDRLLDERPLSAAASETRLIGGFWKDGLSLPNRKIASETTWCSAALETEAKNASCASLSQSTL